VSRRKLKPEDMISAIYEDEGFYEVERGEDPESGYINRLVLSNGRKEIAVSILEEEVFTIRGAIQDALLQAEKLKNKFDGVVVAVPRRYQRAVDENVMSLHGLGLVIYDNLGAEEIIPPRFQGRDESKKERAQEAGEKSRYIEEEMVKLRIELSKLFRAIEEIEIRINRLEKEQNRLGSRLSRVETQLNRLQRPAAAEIKTKTEKAEHRGDLGKNLPTYLVDNPWINILSRRE